MAEWGVENERVTGRGAPSRVVLSEAEGCPESVNKGQETQMNPGQGGACWWRALWGVRDETEEGSQGLGPGCMAMTLNLT